MKTRVSETSIGTKILIEGSKIISQEACQHPIGTSIAIKNLFFNIPARRNFLKSNNVEIKHIVEEFIRVALAHPDIAFSMYSNDNELYHLKSENLKKRIVSIFGSRYAHVLVPISEDTDIVKISGFIGKPDYAKKTRGDQYIFVNNRFIKSPYLNHAIYRAYEDIIPKDRYPFFILFIEVDPAKIDINVHPSKTEIKFEEEHVIYTFVNAATRHGLAQYSVIPTIDFEQESTLNEMGAFIQEDKNFDPTKSKMSFQNTDFPFSKDEKEFNPFKKPNEYKREVVPDWEDLYSIAKNDNEYVQKEFLTEEIDNIDIKQEEKSSKTLQIANRYILSPIKTGYIIIDQQAAHERILFERYLKAINGSKHPSQKLLFPKNIELNGIDAEILREIMQDINQLGFDIQEFGNNSFVVQGIPADIEIADEKTMIEDLLEQFRNNMTIVKLNKRESLVASLSVKASIKTGKILSFLEMNAIIDELFSCQNPYKAPNGKKIFVKTNLGEIEKLFI